MWVCHEKTEMQDKVAYETSEKVCILLKNNGERLDDFKEEHEIEFCSIMIPLALVKRIDL